MEFRILGALEVVEDGRSVDLGGPKQRALLAALLLRANDVVSQDALIDDLWGESPPASAVKTLQAYVSRLRKALAGERGERPMARLETRAHGYVLRIPAESLDAILFQRGLEEGRQALARDDAKQAADLLRGALALWRGPALSDLAYESFAQREIARLEELRLTALEERIDADLALRREDELIGELETLVERHPLRDRLRGQLMLALYRAGRQAQALRVYQEGRRQLAAELGLEPGEALRRLERRILEQDPGLGAASRRTRPAIVPAPAWRHPARVAIAGAVVLAVAAGLAVWRLAGGEAAQRTAGAIALDPAGALRKTIPFGTAPSSVAVGEGSIWVLDGADQTVTQIDPETNEVVRVFGTSSRPTDIGVGADAVWVGNGGSGDLSDMPRSVSRIDPASGVVVRTIALPPPAGGNISGIGGFSRQKIAVTPDAVWVINPDQSVSRIDPRTNRVVKRVKAKAEVIAAGEGDVWIGQEGGIAEIDTARNVVSRRIPLGEDTPSGLAVGGGSVWAADPFDGSVWRIPRDRPADERRIPLTRWVNVVASGAGSVWATNEIADEVYRIDPQTNTARIVARTASPRGVAAGDGGAWVVAASPPSRDAALPSPACSAVLSGGDAPPRLLLVSDLPLQGESRAVTEAIADGARHVLEQRGFDAGGYTVGFQSCDSSTAQSGGSDFFRCGSLAKAYARNLRVVGIVGSFASPCSYVQIPVTNQAPEGPLAMLSPSNTYQGLTEDDGLYPTGVRSYVRIAGDEHLQAVAHAELAKQLGARRVAVLSPRGESPYPTFPRDVRTAGRELGMEVMSFRYDPEAKDFAPFARSVARARPDAVIVADNLYSYSAAVIRAVRAAAGSKPALLAPDGFAGLYDGLVKLAGPAAKGMYVSQYGIANEKLPPRGREFLESFASGRPSGPGPDYAAAYGAQAAEILLDAIARSDGTRASVTREVFRTRVTDGILGDIRFDRKGDLVDSPFTFVRMVGDPSSKAGLHPEVDRVVLARSARLRRGR